MSDNLSYDETCLLRLLGSALSGSGSVSLEKPPNWRAVFDMAKSHAVLSLLYDVLIDLPDLPKEFSKLLADESRKTVLQSYRLLFLSRALVDLLEELGIKSLILKGVSASELYPVPELRKSGDVDILIFEPKKIETACQKLKSIGFTVNADYQAEHHLGIKSPENIEIELHTMFAEPFDNNKLNRYMNDTAASCSEAVVVKEIMGVSLPVLSDAYQAYSLLLHMLNHFLRSGFGIKLLCDWVVFWNRTYSAETQALYLKLVKESGIKGFSDAVTLACTNYLGLKYENVKFMFGENVRLRDEEIAGFICDIIDAEEFGKSEKERMVALKGTGIFDYIREFHHQTCLNFPKASRVFILLPALWGIALLRFLRNNRKLRRVSTRSVLTNAHKRGKLIKRLKLFEKI